MTPISVAFLIGCNRVFETIIVSSVVNRCSFAHSNRRLRVFPVDILVSLTIVHVPHSGHLIGGPFVVFWSKAMSKETRLRLLLKIATKQFLALKLQRQLLEMLWNQPMRQQY